MNRASAAGARREGGAGPLHVRGHRPGPGRGPTGPLDLALAVLPYLRGGLTPAAAERTVDLLVTHLDHIDAAAVVDTEVILAYAGLGRDHHRPGDPIQTRLTKRVLATGRPVTVTGRRAIGCRDPACPLGSAFLLPLQVQGRTVGALKLYRADVAPIGPAERAVAEGLARLFGLYLELGELDARAARVTQAELEALRAQISPHFLFNTLTTIASLIRTDPVRAHDLVIEFAQFFRETLSHHAELVPLRDELRYVDGYLALERARWGDLLRVQYRVSPEALQATVPVLVIQPLVENAINHGLAPRGGPGRVSIHATAGPDGVTVSVADDGVGIPPARIGEILQRGRGAKLGMGLANVHQRLQSYFGPASGLRIRSRPGQGTEVSFWIPRNVRRL